MLTKMINGEQIVCSDQEEKLIRMSWDLNDKYPEYSGHLAFDGISEPKHDMVECKKAHIVFVNQIIQKKMDDLFIQIQIAEESGDGASRSSLIKKRGSLRSQMNPDLSSMETIDSLKNQLETVKGL